MYLVDFIAVEPRTGEVELDLDNVDTREEAREIALKAIQMSNPTYEDIQIIEVRDLNG